MVLEADMSIKVLPASLGHAQASTTLNLYGHALADYKRNSIEKMRGFYGASSDTHRDGDEEYEDVRIAV